MIKLTRRAVVCGLAAGLSLGYGCASGNNVGGSGASGDFSPATTELAATPGDAGTVAVSQDVQVQSAGPATLAGGPPAGATSGTASVAAQNVRFLSGPAKTAIARQSRPRHAQVDIHVAPADSDDPCADRFRVLGFTATEDDAGAINLDGQTSAPLTGESLESVAADHFAFCFRIVANFSGTVVVDRVDVVLTESQDSGSGNDNDNDNTNDNDNGNDNGSGDPAPPRVTCPADLTAECAPDTNTTDLDTWLAGASVESDCDNLTLTDDFVELSDDCGATGSVTVTWTATDDCGTDSCSATFTIEDTTDPVLTAPADLIGLCEGGTDLSDLGDWLAAASADDTCGDVIITNDFEALSEACDAVVTWTATDDCANTSTASATVTVVDTDPPLLTLNGAAEMTLECAVDAYDEPGATAADDCDTTLTDAVVGGDAVDAEAVGTYLVTYDATDACGNQADPLSRTVEVLDTLPPQIEEPQLIEVWPPNHNYWTLSLADCGVFDLCDADLDVNQAGTILAIYSDEPENANGDGNTTDDVVILDHSSFMVRAERQGGGNGRMYVVSFEISDAAGNRAELQCHVGVPHDQSGNPPVDDGADAGYTVLPE